MMILDYLEHLMLLSGAMINKLLFLLPGWLATTIATSGHTVRVTDVPIWSKSWVDVHVLRVASEGTAMSTISLMRTALGVITLRGITLGAIALGVIALSIVNLVVVALKLIFLRATKSFEAVALESYRLGGN